MTYISVNGPRIRKNAVQGTREPVIRIARTKSDSKPQYAHEIKIDGPSELVYSPDKPLLKCGARLAIHTTANVEIVR